MEKIIYGEFTASRRVKRCIGRPSPRANQVLQLLGEGYEADEIAGVLGMGCGTVRTYLNKLQSIVGVGTMSELRTVALAWQRGFVRLYVPIDRAPLRNPLPRSRALEQLRAQRANSGIVPL